MIKLGLLTTGGALTAAGGALITMKSLQARKGTEDAKQKTQAARKVGVQTQKLNR